MLLLAGSVLFGCASGGLPQPIVDHNRDYDFTAAKTFAFMNRKSGPAESVVLSDMEINRVNNAFERALTMRGLTLVEKREDADILISWLLVTKEQTDVRSYNSTSYYQCWGCGPAVSDVSVRQYTQGTLIVDMVDPEMRKSVWRSVVQSKLNAEHELEGQQERFNNVAEHMMAAYPPQ
ncbi:DUF4136 domain-containing protein [Halieaceae bacterium IMCC14734]|uniref:DUF4136 domain-containing protein n=2 Tax=Candidatus Litorirhabdus singularis TaxID=2518993 RepID=A0ABT3TK28_9GAMM|nr:DUF4136 domain-containing protein [Candidatus Litorirhabdus singularis]